MMNPLKNWREWRLTGGSAAFAAPSVSKRQFILYAAIQHITSAVLHGHSAGFLTETSYAEF